MGRMERIELDGYRVILVNRDTPGPAIVVFGGLNDVGRRGEVMTSQIELAQAHGITAFFVVPLSRHWYQNVRALLYNLNQLLKGRERRIAIGSDMGAYGAVRFAERLLCDDAVLLNPVASTDPRSGPCDWRFDEDHHAIGSCASITQHNGGHYWVIYDPGSPDRRHLEALDLPRARTSLIPMPVLGPSAFPVLSRSAEWQDFLGQLLAGERPPVDRPALMPLRRDAARYLQLMAERNAEPRPSVTQWALDRMTALGIRPRYVRIMRRRLGL